MVNDLKYALRQLFRDPGFTAIAVLTLALGIGANTAIFSVINAVLLKPLPFPDPDRLVQVMRRFPQGNADALSASKFSFLRQHASSFEQLAASDFLGAGANLVLGDNRQYVSSVRVSSSYFPMLGVDPLLGRTFSAEEDQPGGARAAVISHGLWRRTFNGDPHIAGKPLTLGGESYTVVGVMPPGFQGRPAADVWTPLRAMFNPQDKANSFLCLGRIRHGVTPELAQADLDRIISLLRREHPELASDQETAAVVRYRDQLVGETRRPLTLIFAAVVFVLLIACVNVANLLLSRAAVRSREVSVRAALGANRLRLIRQLMTESLLLAGAGGAIGMAVAYFGLKALLALIPDNLPRVSEIGIDVKVLGFTVGIAAAAGVLFGLVPAIDAGRLNLVDALRDGSGRTTGGVPRVKLRNFLVGWEIALSVLLLTGAALLMRTFANLQNQHLGFDPDHILTLKLSLNDPRYDTTAASQNFFDQVITRIEQMPGVEAAAYATSLPLEEQFDLPFEVPGRSENASGDSIYRHTTPKYFRALGIPLRQGRYFAATDTQNSPGVMIVNESFARQFFPNEDPIGRHITVARVMGPDWADREREIVGVVADVRELGVRETPVPTMFIAQSQTPDPVTRFANRQVPASLVVKAKGNPANLAAAVRDAVRVVDSAQSVANLRTMDEVMSGSISRQRFNMLLVSVFAGVALLLSAVGIYGVMAYSVQRRTQEIGIRMALGAQAGAVFRGVLRQGGLVTFCGIGIGLLAALGVTRFLSSLLYQVSPHDPVTFAIVPIVLAGVSMLACSLPARRAAKVDPMVALRTE